MVFNHLFCLWHSASILATFLLHSRCCLLAVSATSALKSLSTILNSSSSSLDCSSSFKSWIFFLHSLKSKVKIRTNWHRSFRLCCWELSLKHIYFVFPVSRAICKSLIDYPLNYHKKTSPESKIQDLNSKKQTILRRVLFRI